jgi:hypothetical protein
VSSDDGCFILILGATVLVALAVAFSSGFEAAEARAAVSCDHHGAFYVGDVRYACHEVKEETP